VGVGRLGESEVGKLENRKGADCKKEMTGQSIRKSEQCAEGGGLSGGGGSGLRWASVSVCATIPARLMSALRVRQSRARDSQSIKRYADMVVRRQVLCARCGSVNFHRMFTAHGRNKYF
jgi:hypothetical protein